MLRPAPDLSRLGPINRCVTGDPPSSPNCPLYKSGDDGHQAPKASKWDHHGDQQDDEVVPIGWLHFSNHAPWQTRGLGVIGRRRLWRAERRRLDEGVVLLLLIGRT